MHNDGMELKDGTHIARKLLQESSSLDHDMSDLIGPSRLDILDKFTPQDLAILLADENVQTQAIILAHIDARRSFETLEIIPVKLRSPILARIAKLEPLAPSFLQDLNRRLEERLDFLTSTQS